MAIARDASSPARFNLSSTTAATGTESGTSASFTPPLNAWIYAGGCINSTVGSSPTFGSPTNTGGGLSAWTLVKSQVNASGGSVGVWRAFVNSSVATTVTVSVTTTGAPANQANDAAGWVDVWTGAATSQTGAATASGNSTTTNFSPTITTTASNSRVAGVAIDWQAAGTPTSTDTIDGYTQTGQTSGGRAYKATNSGAAGSVALNFHSPGTPQWAYVLYEILSAAGGSTFNVSGSDSLGLADSATNTLAAKATGSDSLALADSSTNTATRLASVSDSLALSDSGVGGSIFAKSASDTLALSDSATRTSTLPASGSDSLALSDASTNKLSAVASGSDSLALSDSRSSQLQAIASGSDSLSLTDSSTATQSGASATDSLGLSDLASGKLILSGVVSDSLNLGDGANATGGSGGITPAGRHRRRFGVLDDGRLLIFDTRAEADAAQRAIATRDLPKPKNARKKIKVKPIPPPAEIIPLPQIAAAAESVGEYPRYQQLFDENAATRMAEFYQAIRDRREEEDTAVHLLHLDREERQSHITHLTEAVTALNEYLRRRR